MNGLLLQRYAFGFEGFSEADVNVLTQIAQQCVGRGGEGVYIARSLLTEQTKEAVEYNDECIQALDSRSSKGENTAVTAASSLQVMPNPTNDRAKVILPNGHSISSLTLLDAYGRLVQVFEITPGQNAMDMNTAGLRAGVYFLAPSNQEGSPVRFTVLH